MRTTWQTIVRVGRRWPAIPAALTVVGCGFGVLLGRWLSRRRSREQDGSRAQPPAVQNRQTAAPALPPFPEANLAQLFRNRSAQYADTIRWRQRKGDGALSMTYRENQRTVNRVIAGLDALGARPGDAIGIVSGTRWEWLVADWAIMGLGAFTTTLFPNLTHETLEFILRDSGARYLFIENVSQYKKVRRCLSALPRLEKMILFDEDAATLADPMVMSFSALLAPNARSDEECERLAAERARDIQPDAWAGLIYTSGTTGMPKGVIHTHQMLLIELACAHSMLNTVHPGIIDALFLPLSHGMGRLEHLFTFEFGGETVIIPSLAHLARDIRDAQPDMLLAAPRVFEKAHSAITSRVARASALQRALFNWALGAGQRAVRYRQAQRRPPLILRPQLTLADRLVFRRLRAAFGGRLQLAVSGGAPIDPSLVTFFHAIGIPLLEAWGLTETTTALTLNQLDRFRVGAVGMIFPGHEARIDADGEVLVRGPCIFPRYHNNPQATAEALDADGWLHTGDVGALDSDGFLSIVDRKKDLIVTPGGEKIAPQRVEALIGSIPIVAQACVYGEGKPYLVSLLTIDRDALRTWATEHGVGAAEVHALVESERLRAYLDGRFSHINSQLAPFERIRRYAVLAEEFTVENGLLAPSFKIRRKSVNARYQERFEQLYGTVTKTPSLQAAR